MNGAHPLILGASQPTGEGFRSEVCDSCFGQVWLAPPIQSALDDAEDAGSIATLLCADCALARYGPRLAELLNDQGERDIAA